MSFVSSRNTFGVFLRLFRFVLVSNSTILSSDIREQLGCRAAGRKQGCNFYIGQQPIETMVYKLPLSSKYGKRRDELAGGLLANQKRRIILNA